MGLDLRHVVPSPKTNKVEALDFFTLEELSACTGYIERHRQLLTQIDDELGKVEVMYYVEKGYQRKGMNPKFYEDFQNDKLYFDLKSVHKALEYLQGTALNPLEELQTNFQKNFIDNFVEGESIFYASW